MFKQCQQHLCRFSFQFSRALPGHSPPPLPRVLPLSLSLSLSLPLFRSVRSVPSFDFPSSYSRVPVSRRLAFVKNIPLSVSLPLFSRSACACVTTITRRRRTRDAAPRANSLGRVGRIVVFEYNMYPVYPAG